jgi:hypothetical protein
MQCAIYLIQLILFNNLHLHSNSPSPLLNLYLVYKREQSIAGNRCIATCGHVHMPLAFGCTRGNWAPHERH